MKKGLLLIITLLVIGIVYRLTITGDGNFIFNMDNARDMVDVREMVVLGKPRLIGPTSGVEGFFNGPFWYYLLAIPFVVTSGDPYGGILLMIAFWTIGGYFLLKILNRFGPLAVLSGGALWIASDYVLLASHYAFNPNPVILLTPLFIFLLEKYLKSGVVWYGVALWLLGGLFFNFEMAFGIFIPAIVVLTFVFSGKGKLLASKKFLFGFGAFAFTLLPQLLFELRHGFFMTRSVLNFLANSSNQSAYLPWQRLQSVSLTYWSILSGTLMNWQPLVKVFGIILAVFLVIFIKNKSARKEPLLLIIILFLLVPFIGQVLLPAKFMPWHLGGGMAAAILFLAVVVGKLTQKRGLLEAGGIALMLAITFYAIFNLNLKDTLGARKPPPDVTILAHEIAAVDYVYQKAAGKNFKVYVYLPSVIDYAYLPGKPPYINNKEKFNSGGNPPDSNLVFLIKQPDTRGELHLWENSFKQLPLIESVKVGPLVIEIRNEIPDNT